MTATADVSSLALLVTGGSGHVEIEPMLRELGFMTLHVGDSRGMADVIDPVSLCLVDLRENGEAMRVALSRAYCTSVPVFGLANAYP